MNWHLYSEPARRAIMIAQKQAMDSRTNLIRPVHVALGCVAVDGNVRRMLESLNRRSDIEDVLVGLSELVSTAPNEPNDLVMSPIAKTGIDAAMQVARLRAKRTQPLLKRSNYQIQTLDLVAGMMQGSVQISAMFKDNDVTLRHFVQEADYMPAEVPCGAQIGRAPTGLSRLFELASRR